MKPDPTIRFILDVETSGLPEPSFYKQMVIEVMSLTERPVVVTGLSEDFRRYGLIPMPWTGRAPSDTPNGYFYEPHPEEIRGASGQCFVDDVEMGDYSKSVKLAFMTAWPHWELPPTPTEEQDTKARRKQGKPTFKDRARESADAKKAMIERALAKRKRV